MLKKDICITFGITSNMTFAIANIMLGIERYTKGVVDTYIIFYANNDPIEENEKDRLRAINSNIEFREYHLPEDIQLPVNIINRYSELYMAKFEIFNLLKEFKKVLWLDADILIQGDISEIFNYEPIAWRKTVIPFNKKITTWNGKNVDDSFTAPNGGVILVTDKLLNYEQLYKDTFVVLRTIKTELVCLDELVFGILNFKYNLGVRLLPQKFNSGAGWRKSQFAHIVHCIGEKKFWNDAIRYLLFPQWGEFNDKYIQLGGENKAKKLKNSESIGKDAKGLIIAFSNFEYWSSLLQKSCFSKSIIYPHNLFKRNVIFYVKNIKDDIHYELIKLDEKKVKVALCFGKESFVQLGGQTLA